MPDSSGAGAPTSCCARARRRVGDLVELGFDERRIRARAVGRRGGARVRRRHRPRAVDVRAPRSVRALRRHGRAAEERVAAGARHGRSRRPVAAVVAGAPGWGDAEGTSEAGVTVPRVRARARPAGPVLERDGVRLPEPRRGLRHAGRRGDGLRAARGDEPRHGDGGDRRRRRRAGRRGRRRFDPRRASPPRSTTHLDWSNADAPAPPTSVGTRPPTRRWPRTARWPDDRRARRRRQPAVAGARQGRRLRAVPRAPARRGCQQTAGSPRG